MSQDLHGSYLLTVIYGSISMATLALSILKPDNADPLSSKRSDIGDMQGICQLPVRIIQSGFFCKSPVCVRFH